MSNESIYDEGVESVEVPQDSVNEEDFDNEDEETQTEWKPTVSSESPKDKLERMGIRKIMDGKTLTVKSYAFTKPRTKKRDGTAIEPKPTQDGSKFYYPGKLKIKFEEDNLVEYYPNFHYFVNDGVVSNYAKINRSGTNAVSSLFKLIVDKIGQPEQQISDQQAFEFLIGKKVLIETKTGEYLKKKWFRNDIAKFVD